MTKLRYQSVRLISLTANVLPETESESSTKSSRDKSFTVSEIDEDTFYVIFEETIRLPQFSGFELTMRWQARYRSATPLTKEDYEALLQERQELLYPVWAQASIATAWVTEKFFDIPIITNPIGDGVIGKDPKNDESAKPASSRKKK